MAGVPGVFWRCPAVLQGPSTHNPTLVLRKTHTSKNWPIFPICMWKWGGSAPSGQARVSRPNWPQCAKSEADLWQIWPYSRYRGPDSHMQSGASPGSSVGDTNDWILFLWFILIVFCPWFRSATSHPVQNTQNHRFFDPKHHFLTHERQKIKKSIFFKSPQFLVP